MPFVTAIFARRMIQAAGTSVDSQALLRSIGLNPDAPLDVTERVASDAYYDLLERIVADMDADRGHGVELPLRVGPLMRPDDYGALGLAWKSAPSVRDSLERVERYCRLWTDNMTYEVREIEGGIDFLLHRFGKLKPPVSPVTRIPGRGLSVLWRVGSKVWRRMSRRFLAGPVDFCCSRS